MDPNIVLGGMLLIPLVVIMALKINATLVFLSLCLGNVLMQFVGRDAATIISSASARAPGVPPSEPYVNIILLLLPVVLTMFIMIHSVKGAKLTYNLLPALGVSALLPLLIVPLLSPGLTDSIRLLPLWHQLENLQTIILSVTASICLLYLWMQRPAGAHGEGHSKHE